MSITLADDYALKIATAPGMNPLIRLVLLAAERAEANGIAEFDQGELADLMANPETGELPTKHGLRQLIYRACKLGYLAYGSTRRKIILPAEITKH